MRESRLYGSVRGALSNGRPYRDLITVDARPPLLIGNKRQRDKALADDRRGPWKFAAATCGISRHQVGS
jgi:hypothetical protein